MASGGSGHKSKDRSRFETTTETFAEARADAVAGTTKEQKPRGERRHAEGRVARVAELEVAKEERIAKRSRCYNECRNI